jgi:hypothetical protein
MEQISGKIIPSPGDMCLAGSINRSSKIEIVGWESNPVNIIPGPGID